MTGQVSGYGAYDLPITLIIKDCTLVSLTSFPFTATSYNLGEPELRVSLSNFGSTIPQCGSLTFTHNGLAFVNIDSVSQEVVIYSTDPIDLGSHIIHVNAALKSLTIV